jgi:hypothetical protein
MSERVVYVYGESDDTEVLTVWMENDGRIRFFVSPDIFGYVQNEKDIPPNCIGVTCTRPLQVTLSPVKIVSDAQCRQLHNQVYG